ncbi:hypothetical protein HPB51_018918 [Rhipicephalus microplus]|uniref:Uncharacterized protein n=1 Tax=Rhipicephalus microplus TaxID=6941 RepID=A0A9J6DPV8_RHIMP|nr:hypothetical protein HPB51_018918 [Rhipicephalus microplus]
MPVVLVRKRRVRGEWRKGRKRRPGCVHETIRERVGHVEWNTRQFREGVFIRSEARGRLASVITMVCPECLAEVKSWSGLLCLTSSFDGVRSQRSATAVTRSNVGRRAKLSAVVPGPRAQGEDCLTSLALSLAPTCSFVHTPERRRVLRRIPPTTHPRARMCLPRHL